MSKDEQKNKTTSYIIQLSTWVLFPFPCRLNYAYTITIHASTTKQKLFSP